MRKLLCAALLLLAAYATASPVIFYTTYADFKNKKGTDIGEFKEYSILNGTKNYLRVINKEGKKITYNNKELGAVWGLEMEGIVYRFVKGFNAGQLFEAMHIGEKVSVFEDAYPRISAASEKEPYTPATKPGLLFFTDGAEGDITMLQPTLKKKIKESQREEFPKLAPVFDCLEALYNKGYKNYTQQQAIQCFVEFDKK